jgi:phosphoglycolate phosphatase-like HAD superfamily hydrolase
MATRLVLWDIDHTLIETRGVGGEVHAEAFAKVTGHPLAEMPELAGRTEPVIFREALKVNGLEPDEDLYEEFAAEQAAGHGDAGQCGHAPHLETTRGRRNRQKSM